MISCALIALALGGLLFIILPDGFQTNEASQTLNCFPRVQLPDRCQRSPYNTTRTDHTQRENTMVTVYRVDGLHQNE
jgi:hypothetical protein